MIKFILFLLLCAFTSLSSAGRLSDIFSSNWPVKTISHEAPWFCHGIDCAKFELKDTYKHGDLEIELRRYEGERLFSYISGFNEEKQKIEMTAPVKTMDKVPTPTSADVFIEDAPAASYYVISYSGFSPESKMLDDAFKACKALDDLKLAYD
eukprot:gene18454-24934_t